jgi:DnaJ family protein C protein 7
MMSGTIIDITTEFAGNVEETTPIKSNDAQTLAELKKERGNELFKIKKYQQAIELYTEAIELCPDSSAYYGNRSACYMMLHQYRLGLDDARKAVSLDRSFARGYIRIAKCSLALGEPAVARNAFSAVRELSINNSAILPEVRKLHVVMKFDIEAKKAYHRQDYKKAMYCIGRILDHIPCTRYKLQKAVCLASLGTFKEAQNIANGILDIDERNVDAIYMRGVCLYHQGNMKQALNHFKCALHLAPNHGGAINNYKRVKALLQKMEEGDKAYNEGRCSEAYSTFTEALKLDPKNNPVNTKLFFSRALVCSRLGRLTEAVADCSSALEISENYPNALLVRAQCYMGLRDFDKAVRDYEKAFEMDKSQETRRLLENAKSALKNSEHKDYYSIFGVNKNASADEIKKAYRKKALIHHPDRHMNASEAERKEQEKKFKEVGAAFEILSSPQKRARYDNICTEATEHTGSTFNGDSAHQAHFTKRDTGQFNC